MTTFNTDTERVLIVEAPYGSARWRWLDDMAVTRARSYIVSADFDLGGPWAGVSDLFAALLPDIREKQPELIEQHVLELVYVLPQLRRSLVVRNPTLTDLAPASERTRNYPADRAFRNVHGLIDLLDTWKTSTDADAEWVIACDGFDRAGAMGSLFFRELMRRRGEKLRLRLLVGVEPGSGEKTRSLFNVPAAIVSVDLAPESATEMDAGEAAQIASEMEERIGDDRLERQLHLPGLIRLWDRAGRADKVLEYRSFGLETYNTLGLYEDALRYGRGVFEMAAEQSPGDDFLRWSILIKLLMSHIGLNDVDTSLKLADTVGRELVERNPDWGIQLFYLMAIFYARFLKPRDLAKGEEYLERGLALIENGDVDDDDRHFQFVFNRNGLAMIRGFQKRYQEAIQLCAEGIERLIQHLGTDRHRLHRSVLFYNTAQVYGAIGSYAQAIDYYTRAIEMDPNYSEYYNERGNVFLQIERLEEARADYVKAIELSPPYFEVFTNLGQCYRRMGAMEEAVEAYSRALDLQPDQVLALLGRGKAHEELGHTNEAIADYTEALDRDSTLWEAVASRGVMHYEAGDLRASLTDFNRAIELKPDHGDLYQNRATVLADLGAHSEAAHDFERALMLHPSDDDEPVLRAKLEAAIEAAA